MPNRFLQKLVPHDTQPLGAASPSPPPPSAEAQVTLPDRILITTESLCTNASEPHTSRTLTTSPPFDARSVTNNRGDAAGAPGTSGSELSGAGTGRQRTLGRAPERNSSGGGRFARIRGLLPGGKPSASSSGVPLPSAGAVPGPVPPSGAGLSLMGGAASARRLSATGNSLVTTGTASCSGVGPGAVAVAGHEQKERSLESMDAGAAGGGRPPPRRQKSNSQDKTGRWWAACLAPPRLREGEPDEHGIMLDTVGSAGRPLDMITSTDIGGGPGLGSGAAVPPQAQQQQVQQQAQLQQGAGQLPSGGGGGVDGSVGSSGQMDPERFARFRKPSGRHLRASLERNLQNRATRNGSGPGGMASGGPGSVIFATNESKPRDSFESDWDVMGAENDGNALSAAGIAMSTTTGFDGNSGGGNAGGGGSRGPTALMAAVAAAMANASSGGGGEASTSGRQQSKLRRGSASAALRNSREYAEAAASGVSPQQLRPPLGQQRHQQGEEGMVAERLQRNMMRSPTSSSNVPVDLSFNPNLHDLTAQRAAGAGPGTSVPPRRGGSGEAPAGGPAGAAGEANDGGGDSSSHTGRPTPEDLLTAQMMAIQNRINALTDEDLLNPSSALPFVSPSPSQRIAAIPQQPPQPSPHMTYHQLNPGGLGGGGSPLPYQLASSGSEAALGMGPGGGGSSANLAPTGQQPFPTYPHPQHPQQQSHPHTQHAQQHYLLGAAGAQPGGLQQQQQHHHHHHHQPLQHGLQAHGHGPSSAGMPPMSGMGALDALSAFLGSPPSRAASMYDGGGGILMTTGATAGGGSGLGGARASAGSPGSVGGGAAAGGARSGAGTAGGAGGAAGGGGMRSMQSINEDGFLAVAVNQAGGSSYRLASSHLGGMGAATSNSSFLSIRPGPGSDDPGGAGMGMMLSTREDTGVLGPSSRVHAALARTSDTMDPLQQQLPGSGGGGAAAGEHARAHLGAQANILLFTRGSSLGDRYGYPGAIAGVPRPAHALPSSSGDAALSLGPTPSSIPGSEGAAARSPLPPITAPPAGAGAPGGGGRFTLAAALSRVQEELQKSIVPPMPGAAGAPAAGAGGSGSIPAAASSSKPIPSKASSGRSATGSGAGSADGAASSLPGGWAHPPAGSGTAALTAAALGRGGPGFVRELGSSNGVVVGPGGSPGGLAAGSGGGVFVRLSSRRSGGAGGAGPQPLGPHHPHHPHPSNTGGHSHNNHCMPDSPDAVMQQLLNSNTTGAQHQFPGGSGGLGVGPSHPHPHPHQPLPSQQQHPLPGGGPPAAATATGTPPSGDPPSGSRRHSTDYLYEEFFSNAPLQYEVIGQVSALAGGPASGHAAVTPSPSPIEAAEVSVAPLAGNAGGYGGRAGGVAGAAGSAGLALGPGPPPVQGRSVRRNVSTESLRVQAAHRSMEGRAAAAAAAGAVGVPHGAVWLSSAALPSPLSSSGGRPPSPQAAPPLSQDQQPQRQGQGQGAGAPSANLSLAQQQQQQQQQQALVGYPGGHAGLGEAHVEGAGSAEAAAAAVAASTPVASSTGGSQGTGHSYGGQRRSSISGNGSIILVGSSNGTTGPESHHQHPLPPMSPPPPPPPPSVGLPGGVGSGLFLDGSANIRHPVESARVAAAAAAAATAASTSTAVTNSPDVLSSGAFGAAGAAAGGGVLSSTDAVVAGLMESVLRSGVAASLQEDGGGSGSTGTEESAAAAAAATAAAQGLAVLPRVPRRSVSVGLAGPSGRTALAAASAPGLQPLVRGRPASGGRSARASGGGGAVAAASSPSLDALLAFRDESGQPLVHLVTPLDVARLSKQQQQQQELLLLREQQQQLQLRRTPAPHSAAEVAAALDLTPRPQYGVCEVMLLAAGILVVLFNLIVVVYVLVSVQLMELRAGSGGGGGQHFPRTEL